MLSAKIVDTTFSEMKFIIDLYENTFPSEEKVPLSNIKRTFGNGGNLYVLFDDSEMVGSFYMFDDSDVTFLVYIAIRNDLRGKGYGSDALNIIRGLRHRVFLVMEEPDGTDIKDRRKEFYLRNGCCVPGFMLLSDDVMFDAVTLCGDISESRMNEAVKRYEDVHNGRIC